MVLCEHYYDPESGRVVDGLNLVPNACVLPHHNSFGKRWAPKLIPHLPDSVLIGIDEATGIINDGGSGHWQVYGAGHTILYRRNTIHRFGLGDRFVLDRTDDRASSP
jgi:cyanophycinase